VVSNLDLGRCLVGKVVVLFFPCSLLLFAQTNSGELRLRVTDPSGQTVKAPIQVICEANQYRRILNTDDEGSLIVQHLPFGAYQLDINPPGFAEVSQPVDVHSSIPSEH
jgi:hypothetical protein